MSCGNCTQSSQFMTYLSFVSNQPCSSALSLHGLNKPARFHTRAVHLVWRIFFLANTPTWWNATWVYALYVFLRPFVFLPCIPALEHGI